MTGKCELCPAEGVPLGRTYKENDLGANLCTCCQIKVFNLMLKAQVAPEHVDIVRAFARFMPGASRPRRATRRLRPARPVFVASDWCAHSLPPSDL